MSRPTSLEKTQTKIDEAFISERLETAAVQVLEDALSATVMVRGSERGPDGRCIYIEKPDHAVRLMAAVRVLEWRRGKPAASLTLTANSTREGRPAQSLAEIRQRNPELFQKLLASYADAAKPAVRVEDVEAIPSSKPGNR